MAFKLDPRTPWPEYLRPVGVSTREKESFATWYNRNKGGLEHLDCRALEQWVYRHWEFSPYAGIRLASLVSKVETWSGSRLVSEVGFIDDVDARYGRMRGGDDPEEYLGRFVLRGGTTFEPGTSMGTTGTWNFPILVMRSSEGFVFRGERFPAHRFWLIEGHLRFRYLRALRIADRPDREHEVIILRRR